MRTWKLVSGILSIVFACLVLFQSCAASVVLAIQESEDVGGAAGTLVGLLMIAAGIVSIATRGGLKKGGNIALMIMFFLAFIIGFTNAEFYGDLKVWASWCFLCAAIAMISFNRQRRGFAE